ncbi:hypothetical protein CVT25_007507 [Psilocybe cyanescens]|uniref:Uncharacterized protein n=1 Tax=Psilocybe cyanescens TaxID=93625 RepID=A0A409WVW6_PSICY|nr:hypothetical protein CVT25_007507 [Psilocybe cyanescens]
MWSESETNILKFLDSVYPTEESCPQYIYIDKACKLLQTSIANGSWLQWQKTNMKDILCRTWCNLAPLNGSAPNLVILERNKEGMLYFKQAFNTQHVNNSTCGSVDMIQFLNVWHQATSIGLSTQCYLSIPNVEETIAWLAV